MQTIRWQLVHSDSQTVPRYPTERQSAQDGRAELQEKLGCRRGQKPEVGGRFVCQSSCKKQEGSRNPRVVVEEAAAQVVGRSR